MRRWILGLILSLVADTSAGDDRTGMFDYYVLSLSWSPNWCARTGIARGSDQCAPDRGLGWSLHGLWPQYETGWPSYCDTSFTSPTTLEAGEMADIMGSAGLARHEWTKHGTCSGLGAAGYFKASRTAYNGIARPFEMLSGNVAGQISAAEVEDEFIKMNPHLKAEQVTVTCKSDQIQEVRICLTKDLRPRDCGADVMRDCTLKEAIFHPIP
ncbi:MAG: ribonuclease T2 [Paracoccaceae bacterium]|nr:ribonuclease T2 [Paracoccaceae bacterium]MDG1737945.1 ribonuclease T2 [Paracoccaceae bacterium]MDG2258821.1 ribonuclease T2 [Paracoccaceae bacterium]